MSNYGCRYLTISNFQSYCADLKTRYQPDCSELEMYEKEGLLLPVARIIKPEGYIFKRRKADQKDETYGKCLSEWEDLERLLYRKNNSGSWHPFDCEFEKKNKFLLQPQIGDFEPWGSLKVEVKSETGDKYYVSSVEHYYHYWQAYLVDDIQSKYPVFAKYNWLLQNLNDKVKDRVSYLKPYGINQIYAIGGYFDALSFFIELYRNEEQHTFSPIVAIDGVKHLNDDQIAFYNEQLKKHSKLVMQRFGLKPKGLYQFMIDILERKADYEKNERLKLADALGNDAIFLTRLIYWATNQSVNKTEKVIGEQAGFFVQRQFRHLDKALEIYDYANETFERLMGKYNQAFPDFVISSSDIDRLLKFIADKKLFIIPYAIFDIDEVLNNSKRFRLTSLYTGLSNLAIGFECFLREMADIVNKIHSNTSCIKTDTLFPMIQGLFTEWGGMFQSEHQKRKNSKLGDIEYIENVITSPGLNNPLKAFLITYKVRNFAHHNYTIEPYFYHNLYSIAYTEICNSLFYCWKYASQNGWV